MRRLYFFLLLFVLTTGCANIKKTYYYEPIKQEGWTEMVNKTGFLQFGTIPPDLTTKCGDTTITVQSAGHVVLALLGPPFVPLFPFVEEFENMATLGFKLESPNNKSKLLKAVIVVDGVEAEPVEKLQFEVASKSSTEFRYGYPLNWWNLQSFEFIIQTNDPACGVLSVPYKKDVHGTYSMLGS